MPQLGYERRFCSLWRDTTAKSFDKVVAGKFSNNGDRDAAVLVTDDDGVSRAAYLPDASRFNSPIWLSRATDINVMRGTGPFGQDVLLVQDGDATREFTNLQAEPLVSELFVWPMSPQPCLQRVFAFKDAAETQWVLGLDVDGTTVHRAAFDASQGVFANAGDITVLTGTRDILEMDYEGDGDSELVLVVTHENDDCVFVTNFTADTLIEQLWLGEAPVEEDGTRNMVAVIRSSDDDDMLVLYGSNGQQHVLVTKCVGQTNYCLLGDFPAKSISVARHDTDEHDDIALGHASELRILVVHRTANDGLTVGGVAELATHPSLDDSGVDKFVMDDLDQDGDVDMLGFQNATRLVHTFDDATKSRRPTGLFATVCHAQWATTQLIPLALTPPPDLPATGVQIRTQVWVQSDEQITFLSGPWFERTDPWTTNYSLTLPGAVSTAPGVNSVDALVLHLHIRFRVGGVDWPSSLLYVMKPYSLSEGAMDDLVDSEQPQEEPGEGDGSVSGNKSNRPPPTDPPQ